MKLAACQAYAGVQKPLQVKAIGCFNKALQIEPDFAEVHNNLGVALQNQGLLDEAAASFGKAVTIKPNYAVAHSNLCGLYEKRTTLKSLKELWKKQSVNCAAIDLGIFSSVSPSLQAAKTSMKMLPAISIKFRLKRCSLP